MMMHSMDHSDHNSPSVSAPPNQSLLDILKRRYAKGEITLTQFEEMKRVLESTEGGSRTMSSDAPTHH